MDREMEKRQTCITCRREFGEGLTHHALGLCKGCYMRAWHMAHPEYDAKRNKLSRWRKKREAAEALRQEAAEYYGVELFESDLPHPASLSPSQYSRQAHTLALARRMVQLETELEEDARRQAIQEAGGGGRSRGEPHRGRYRRGHPL